MLFELHIKSNRNRILMRKKEDELLTFYPSKKMNE